MVLDAYFNNVQYFIAVFNFYISKQLQHETYQGIHQTMDLYVQQLNKSMETAENCLWEFANNNTDVVDTITSKNNPNAVISD